MSLSDIAIEQREKETKSHWCIVAWSIPISIALHLAALVFGVNFLWHNKQEIVKEPIEILTVGSEKVKPKIEKPKPIVSKVAAQKSFSKSEIKKVDRGSDDKKNIIRSIPPPTAKTLKTISSPPKAIVKKAPIVRNASTKKIASKSIPLKPETNSPPVIAKRPLPPLPPLPPRELQPLPTRQPDNNLLTQSNPNSSFALPSQQNDHTSTDSNRQQGDRTSGNESGDTLAKADNQLGEGGGTGGDASGGKVICLECPKPDYPEDARDREIEGKVKVAVDIDAEGNVIDIKVTSSSGHNELDEAALEKAREWKFDKSESGQKGMVIAIDFKLEDAN
jgi:TonB family protein